MVNLNQFKQQGYLILKDFFPKDEIQVVFDDARNVFFRQFVYKQYTQKTELKQLPDNEFNEYLYRLFEEDLTTLVNCGKQAQHIFSLHRLALNSQIESLLKAVGLKSPNICTRPVLFFNHPRLAKEKVFYKVDPHQDWRSMQGSLNSVVIWIPLVDTDKNLGALEIIPKSHLNGLLTDHVDHGFGMVSLSSEDRGQIIQAELSQGDILIFSSFLIHQSGENVTERPRWSCHFRYNDLSEMTFLERKYAHPYIYKPQDELITPNFPDVSELKSLFTINP